MKIKFRVEVIFAPDGLAKIFDFDTEADAQKFAEPLKAAGHSVTIRRLFA